MKNALQTKEKPLSLVDLAKALMHLRKTRKALEERESKIKAQILNLVPSIPFSIPLSGERQLTVNEVQYESIDVQRLKTEFPSVYETVRTFKIRTDIRETKT